MNIIQLTPFDLSIAAGLILILALLSLIMNLGLSRQILVSALRTAVQLILVGFVLKLLFANANPLWMLLISLIMLLAAGREVMARQKIKLAGWRGFGIGTVSMFISSFSVTLFALLVVIGNQPWYAPQYAIPLLGMLLGNTMNGISLGMDRLLTTTWQQRSVIEQKLMMGERGMDAIHEIRSESIRSGMIPIINSMASAGIVSLPGMMTGQILAGSPPMDAVKYQILIMFLIAGGTGFGTIVALWITSKELFDDRHRLRINLLQKRY